MNFDEADVIAVARAMVDPENFATYDSYYDRYDCIYCYSGAIEAHEIKHDTSCPVLIAQDLLTGT